MHGGGGAGGAAMGGTASTPRMYRFGYYTEDKTSAEIGILSHSKTRAQKIADGAALTLGWSSRTLLATRPIGLAVFWGIAASFVITSIVIPLIGTFFKNAAVIVIPCMILILSALTVWLSIKAAQRHNRKVEQLMAEGQPPHAVL